MTEQKKYILLMHCQVKLNLVKQNKKFHRRLSVTFTHLTCTSTLTFFFPCEPCQYLFITAATQKWERKPRSKTNHDVGKKSWQWGRKLHFIEPFFEHDHISECLGFPVNIISRHNVPRQEEDEVSCGQKVKHKEVKRTASVQMWSSFRSYYNHVSLWFL